MAVKIQVEVYWVVMLCRWRQQGPPNVGILLQHYTVLQSRWPQLETLIMYLWFTHMGSMGNNW